MSKNKILIKNAAILSMDPDIGDIMDGDILINDGSIISIGKNIDACDAEHINASGKIVMPGFVDSHRHVWQTQLRGIAVDWTIVDYMIEMRSHYCICYEPEDAYLGNLVGGLEAINAGVTSIVDHSHLQISPEHSDALASGRGGPVGESSGGPKRRPEKRNDPRT